jgi:sugar transferase (PEP-CTERM/EpsH1 system associated)
MRILWLKTELLHPVDKGGKIRTYAMLRELAKEHDVTYLTLDDGGAAPDAAERAGEYCSRLERVPFSPSRKGSPGFFADLAGNLLSSLPYALSRYRSREFEQRVVDLAASGDFDVVVCDFLTPAVNLPHDLPIPTVLFQHNVEAEIWRRHVEVRRDPVSRAYFAEQYRRMKRFEAAACRRFDLVIAVSEEDARHFEREYGVAPVADVPTGVDVEFFTPASGAAKRPGNLVFTGSMDWMPNEDGIRWFAEEIFPRVRRSVPEASLTVVGRNPPAGISALADRDANVEVTGRVPDVRPYLEQGAVFVVPLRVGGGTRLKIYEGMSMGLPVVSTAIGAEGLPLTDGEHLLIADDPESFASACVQLLSRPHEARELGDRGARYVRERFGWKSVAARFAELCESVRPGVPAMAASASSNHSIDRE